MRWLLRLYQQTMHAKRIIEAIETKVYIDWRTGKNKNTNERGPSSFSLSTPCHRPVLLFLRNRRQQRRG